MILIQAQNLLSAPQCQHGFFGRDVGIDDAVFGTGSASRVKQVHGNICKVIDRPIPQGEWHQADGLVTDAPGVPVGVVTADCAPVLFYGTKAGGRPVIGAAHAGWQGALKDMLEQTVDEMAGLGADISTIRAAVGPCIQWPSYEVSQGFEVPFTDHDVRSERFFREAAGKLDKLMFDLSGYCAFRLSLAGIGNVEITGIDTLGNPGQFYSYRRMTLAGRPNDGRQISAVMISG